MSEELLEAFREEAEVVTRVPDFDALQARGRRRRRTRRGAAAVAVVCTLAVAGLLSAQRQPDAPPPADPPAPSSAATPWPGPVMTTLPRGTYEFASTVGPGSPPVRVTVPRGWNAWEGPNRFEGLGRQVTHDPAVNDRVYARGPEWYADLLLLDVYWIAQGDCAMADMRNVDDPTAMVRALVRVPGLGVVQGPTRSVSDGRDAVHLRLRVDRDAPACLRDLLFQSSYGVIGRGEVGSLHDARVIDVDGHPFLVWASWTRDTPASDVADLLGMVDSVDVR